jgi:hypothetical protein
MAYRPLTAPNEQDGPHEMVLHLPLAVVADGFYPRVRVAPFPGPGYGSRLNGG